MPSPVAAMLLRQPPTGLRALTLAAGVITDATRLANTQDDGLAPGSGFGVWSAATNLITNGGFETNTTGWSGISATISRITAQFKFGAASGQAVTGNASAQEGFRHGFAGAAATQYALSAWVRGAAGGTVVIQEDDNLGTVGQSAPLTMTGAWQRLTTTATTNAGSVAWNVSILTDVQQDITFQCDGVQVETGAIATPYIETDGATAQRAAGTAAITMTGLFTPTLGSLVICARMGWVAGSPPANFLRLWGIADDADNLLSVYYTTPGDDKFTFQRRALAAQITPTSGAQAHAAGDTAVVAATWAANSGGISVNGGAFTTNAGANIPALSTTSLQLLSMSNIDQFRSTMRWALVCKGPLTDADAALVNRWGNPVPTLGQVAMLSFASKPTLLIPARTQDATLLPAFYGS